jgi:hypothetical protein
MTPGAKAIRLLQLAWISQGAAMCVQTRFASWGSSLRFQFEALLGNLIVEILTLELGKLGGK